MLVLQAATGYWISVYSRLAESTKLPVSKGLVVGDWMNVGFKPFGCRNRAISEAGPSMGYRISMVYRLAAKFLIFSRFSSVV